MLLAFTLHFPRSLTFPFEGNRLQLLKLPTPPSYPHSQLATLLLTLLKTYNQKRNSESAHFAIPSITTEELSVLCFSVPISNNPFPCSLDLILSYSWASSRNSSILPALLFFFLSTESFLSAYANILLFSHRNKRK